MLDFIAHFILRILTLPLHFVRFLMRHRLGRYALIGFALLALVHIAQGIALIVAMQFTEPSANLSNGIAGSYLAARHAAQNHDAPRASMYYGDALARQPRDMHLQYEAFRAHLANGDIDAAQELALIIIDNHPQAFMPHLVLLIGDIRDGDWKTSSKRIAHLPQSPLGAFLTPALQAWIAMGHNDKSAMQKAQNLLITQSSFRPVAVLQAALLAMYNGDIAFARRIFDRGWKNGGDNYVYYVFIYGMFLESLDNRKQALRIYAQYRKKHPPHPMLEAMLERLRNNTPPPAFNLTPQKGMARGLYMLANALANDKHYVPALYYTQLALVLDAQFALAQFLRGDILAIQRQWTLATHAYESIDANNVLAERAQIRAAEIYAQTGYMDKAVAILEKLATLHATPDALIALGDIYSRNKQYRDSEFSYSRAIDAIKTTTRLHAHVYFMRGVAHEQLGNWYEAEQDLKYALRLSKNAPHILNYLGYSWAHRGLQLKEALRLTQLAVKQEPQNGAFLDSLGWVYFRLGDMERALVLIERASQLHPNDVEIIDHLGDVLWYVGRKIEARYQWQKATQLDITPIQKQTLNKKLATGRPLITPPRRIRDQSAAPRKRQRQPRARPKAKNELEI